jgi:hypothetical protein
VLSTTPLAFELICKEGVVATLGDAVRVFSELTPDQRDTHWWTTAIHTVNIAIQEPRYLTAATITLQTALRLSGMLAPDGMDGPAKPTEPPSE